MRIVPDNYGTHRRAVWAAASSVRLRFTLTNVSWPNRIESRRGLLETPALEE
jgi:hypothetical protein